MATLYLVSTPIGNLGDISARASDILGRVARILAEDTRRSRILLDHLGLRTPLTSLHAHNEASRTGLIIGWLEAGDDLALITDAGTPLISDPGGRIVQAVVEAGHEVVPIPGASAPLAALVASGLPAERFTFLGFVPRKGKERETLLERIAVAEETTIVFESPERLKALLKALEEQCGGSRRVAVAREITKMHEHFFRGTLQDARAYYQKAPPRGEVTVVIGPAGALEVMQHAVSEGDPVEEVEQVDLVRVDEEAARILGQTLLDRGARPSQAAGEVARRLGIPRNRAYRIIQSLTGST